MGQLGSRCCCYTEGGNAAPGVVVLHLDSPRPAPGPTAASVGHDEEVDATLPAMGFTRPCAQTSASTALAAPSLCRLMAMQPAPEPSCDGEVTTETTRWPPRSAARVAGGGAASSTRGAPVQARVITSGERRGAVATSSDSSPNGLSQQVAEFAASGQSGSALGAIIAERVAENAAALGSTGAGSLELHPHSLTASSTAMESIPSDDVAMEIEDEYDSDDSEYDRNEDDEEEYTEYEEEEEESEEDYLGDEEVAMQQEDDGDMPPDRQQVSNRRSASSPLSDEDWTGDLAEDLPIEEARPPQPGEPICVVCAEAAAVATFVHGSTGHTACCIPCAREVQRRNGTCPLCRRQFQAVIRNFSA